jgi:AAA domain-containing protein
MAAERVANAEATAKLAKKPPIVATPYVWTNPESIPLREWLYGHRIRKYVTATIAPGGVGKSTLQIAEVLSMVSGRALLGVRASRLRVWLWNLEDPRDEITRRIQAAAKHYGLTADDFGDRLFLDSGREQPLVIAETLRTGAVICRPVVDAIIAQLKERTIDMLIIDPFVSCHRVTENDNNAIDMVTKEWGLVADAANCGVELVHHVRKGEKEVTVESARGGGSFGDALRMVRVTNRMTREEAEKAGVEGHRQYFSAHVDKNNLAPSAEMRDWYKLISVDLENNPFGGVGGDSIGVVTKWEWPDATKDLTGRVASKIRAGRWRYDPQAKQWVGQAVADALGYDLDDRSGKAAVRQLLKYWIGTSALVVVEEQTTNRETKKFVRVAEKAE